MGQWRCGDGPPVEQGKWEARGILSSQQPQARGGRPGYVFLSSLHPGQSQRAKDVCVCVCECVQMCVYGLYAYAGLHMLRHACFWATTTSVQQTNDSKNEQRHGGLCESVCSVYFYPALQYPHRRLQNAGAWSP